MVGENAPISNIAPAKTAKLGIPLLGGEIKEAANLWQKTRESEYIPSFEVPQKY